MVKPCIDAGCRAVLKWLMKTYVFFSHLQSYDFVYDNQKILKIIFDINHLFTMLTWNYPIKGVNLIKPPEKWLKKTYVFISHFIRGNYF